MLISYQDLQPLLKGLCLSKPNVGSLSGHQVGEPFDNAVFDILKNLYPSNIFKQYEYLNDLYSKNPNVIGYQRRLDLFNSPTVMFLLSRGKTATEKWSSDIQFEEKQSDTADILCVQNEHYELLDIKTRNLSKSAQPPNIISAFKLAQLCAKMIDNEEYDNLTISYLEIDWISQGEQMVCQNTHHCYLFKARPTNLYINWSASLQIQFHVSDLEQDFRGDLDLWAYEYLHHFVAEARKRASYMLDKFVKPFEKYLQ